MMGKEYNKKWAKIMSGFNKTSEDEEIMKMQQGTEKGREAAKKEYEERMRKKRSREAKKARGEW